MISNESVIQRTVPNDCVAKIHDITVPQSVEISQLEWRIKNILMTDKIYNVSNTFLNNKVNRYLVLSCIDSNDITKTIINYSNMIFVPVSILH
jgi:hypothetical protein